MQELFAADQRQIRMLYIEWPISHARGILRGAEGKEKSSMTFLIIYHLPVCNLDDDTNVRDLT